MKNSVITLGTFDGVHRGHQRIVQRVVDHARQRGGRSVVLAFGMPPRHADVPAHERVLLTTLTEKMQILKQLGVRHVHTLVFDRKTASTPPDVFFRDTLYDRWGGKEIVVGPRVAFGKHRAGRLSLLRRLGKQYKVCIDVVPPISNSGDIISSRKIRSLLNQGKVEKAAQYLGYPYSIHGKVVKGDQRGRQLGYPTANVQVDPYKILPKGVYWVKVFIGPHIFPIATDAVHHGINGLCNIGTRPTFTPNEQALHCEVFLFERPNRLYGKQMRVVLMRKIRVEKRFQNASDLQKQIAEDFRKAKHWSKSC